MATTQIPPATSQKPTRVRYWVIVFAVTLSVITYIDRVCISQAAPAIQSDLSLSDLQVGAMFSAFGLAYALFEIPGGWLGDWLGARRVLMRIVIAWSLFTALTGMVRSFTQLWIVRFLFGAGEAGCFPNLTKVFTVWLPRREAEKAQGIMWSSARWGGGLTPVLVVFTFQFMSWRWAFVMYGLIGVVWAIIFYFWYKDKPSDNKSMNAAELALLKEGSDKASGHGDVPWGRLVSSKSVWFLWFQYFCLSYPWYFYITFLPKYLQEHRGLDQGTAAVYAGFPLIFGGFGSLLAGMLSNRFNQAAGSITRGRRIMAMTGFGGASLLLALSVGIEGILPAMIVMGMASFMNDLVMPPAWATCMDVGGRYAGTLAGSMNMMGNMAGFAAPLVFGWILQNMNKDYNLNLYIMAGVYALGVLCWPFINPDERLDLDDEVNQRPLAA